MSDPRYREYAQYIEKSGAHLLAIIDSVLDIAKIESGMMELKIGVVSLANVLETALLAVRSEALAKHIEVEVSGPIPLPSVNADSQKLLQIIINLLSNSVKFTPEGGSIVIDIQPVANGIVTISVADTGVGMEPEDIEAALQHLFRSKTLSQRPNLEPDWAYHSQISSQHCTGPLFPYKALRPWALRCASIFRWS